jgi:hypothetical protein
MMSPRKKKLLFGGLVTGAVAFGAAQLVPVEGIGSNPPERYQLEAPPEVQAVLRRACFDCHSNETQWPLYSRIAPGSWLMARDVKTGRQHLNMSKWGEVDEEERQMDMETCWEQIEAGEMPKWFYVYPMHLSARLSDADKTLLKGWLLAHQQKKDGAADDEQKGEPKDEKKGEPKQDEPKVSARAPGGDDHAPPAASPEEAPKKTGPATRHRK